MDIYRKAAKKLGLVGLMALGLSMAQAQAALDPAITTAISSGVTDAATLGGLILAFVVGIAVFRHLRSAK